MSTAIPKQPIDLSSRGVDSTPHQIAKRLRILAARTDARSAYGKHIAKRRLEVARDDEEFQQFLRALLA